MAGTGGSRGGAGRPPGAVNKATLEIREAARQHGPQMISELVMLAKESDSHSTRVAAIGMLLDRGYGRPKQELEHSGVDGGPIEFADMSDTEIARRVAVLLSKKKG
jgi:hypothetical protein